MRLMSGSDSAASKTLPLGTTARVRNAQNGRSAVVSIRDRGPHAKNRIIDVSPGIARQLGMTHAGVARVEVVVLRYPAARTPRHAERRPGGTRPAQSSAPRRAPTNVLTALQRCNPRHLVRPSAQFASLTMAP